jgi:spore coat protein A, manganese oxidase
VISRREFLKQSGLLATAWCLPLGAPNALVPGVEDESREVVPRPSISASSIANFVDPLPIPPLARPVDERPDPFDQGRRLAYYRIEMSEIFAKLHRDLPPARLWAYNGTSPGPMFEARKGFPLLVEWVNALPKAHLFAVDHHIHGAEASKPNVRAVVHLHGAKVRPDSDGYPEDWYVPGKSRTSYYPNGQDATMLWYHDHALGITRLNVYAGLFGAYIVRDEAERALNLPSGKYEVPLILCDRKIDSRGQLFYPASPMFHAPWISEFYGTAVLVNGKLLPYLAVEPRQYRFRIVNVSNSRFFSLSLSNQEPFTQIGSDQGLMRAPVMVTPVILAPAERADLVLDFAAHQGKQIVLSDVSGPLMQFRVDNSRAANSVALPATLRRIKPLPPKSAIRTRTLTLDQYNDPAGNVMRMLLNGTHWDMPITERPVLGSIEMWRFVNLTPDPHPIHLHLVRFQILERREFDVAAYQKSKEVHFTGPPMRPDPNEAGWKDTVRCPPKTITRIIARFEGFTGRYVWHCHVLEHEDNEMMRPYEVLAGPSPARKRPGAKRR